MKAVPLEPLDPGTYRELVRRALAEDFGWGDITTEAIIDRDQKARGVIVAKCTCVLAGVDVAAEAFRQLDPAAQVTTNRGDGQVCEPGTEVVEIQGHATASAMTSGSDCPRKITATTLISAVRSRSSDQRPVPNA